MKSIETRIIITTLLFILIVFTGIILNKKRKPYNIAITTVHKFLSLATIVFTAAIIYHQHKLMVLNSLDILLICISGFLFLIALISGGILTINKPVPNYVTLIHKIASGLFIVFCIYVVSQITNF